MPVPRNDNVEKLLFRSDCSANIGKRLPEQVSEAFLAGCAG